MANRLKNAIEKNTNCFSVFIQTFSLSVENIKMSQ